MASAIAAVGPVLRIHDKVDRKVGIDFENIIPGVRPLSEPDVIPERHHRIGEM